MVDFLFLVLRIIFDMFNFFLRIGFVRVFISYSEEKIFFLKCRLLKFFGFYWYVRLNLKGNSGFYILGYCKDEECWRLYEDKVYFLFSQGLSDRVKFIRVVWRNWFSDCRVEDVRN